MPTTVTGKYMTEIFFSTPKFIRAELAKNGPDAPKIIILSPIEKMDVNNLCICLLIHNFQFND